MCVKNVNVLEKKNSLIFLVAFFGINAYLYFELPFWKPSIYNAEESHGSSTWAASGDRRLTGIGELAQTSLL